MLALDHLVIAARTLDAGVAWCEATLGMRPDAGGRHAFMGTHDRVFSIATAMFPRSYIEIVAIDPEADAAAEPGARRRARWFDLDDPALQRAIAVGRRGRVTLTSPGPEG
jgi:Glyoxalase-like domain